MLRNKKSRVDSEFRVQGMHIDLQIKIARPTLKVLLFNFYQLFHYILEQYNNKRLTDSSSRQMNHGIVDIILPYMCITMFTDTHNYVIYNIS